MSAVESKIQCALVILIGRYNLSVRRAILKHGYLYSQFSAKQIVDHGRFVLFLKEKIIYNHYHIKDAYAKPAS